MLKFYYGREDQETNRFLYDRIGETLERQETGKRVILLVPDQYTLQAERDAFFYLKAPGLMDLEILSQSRLGTRILNEAGGAARLHIDKQGRHMLLSGILRRMDGALGTFGGMGRSGGFAELVNDMISELKQYNVAPETLSTLAGNLPERPILAGKLRDLETVYGAYEKAIEGKYTDTEDYMALVCQKASESKLVKQSVFWVCGFHVFTPRMLDLLEQLTILGPGVNVLLAGQGEKGDRQRRDGDLFRLSAYMKDVITERCTRNGISWEEENIQSPRRGKHPALAHLEKELYAYPPKPWDSADAPVRICGCGNFYDEAESAAVEILRLVRDQGFRYRDIAVICNDMDVRGKLALRAFRRYGIPVFADEKRSILRNPAVELVLSLSGVIENGWQFEDVFRLLKTGFWGMEQDDREELENYAIRYKIRGNRWKSSFCYGGKEDDPLYLERLNGLRESVTDRLGILEKAWGKAVSAGEKTAVLYVFLRDELDLPGQIAASAEELRLSGELEAAEEMLQAWGVIVKLMDQIVELSGDEELSQEDYGEMLQSGFESVEIGVIPPASDQVVLGTMQRSRLGRIRALLVLGANDGLLPTDSGESLFLNEEERQLLRNRGYEICKDLSQRVSEEKLAIYKNLAAPDEYLWFSYSGADMEGREQRQSMILDRIREIFPMIRDEREPAGRDDPMERIQNPGGTLPYLGQVLREARETVPETGQEWKSVWNWFRQSQSETAKMMERGLFYHHPSEQLGGRLAGELYKREKARDLFLSPSRLERFSRCPFSHFVLYGLRPEERRVFEVAGRETGDVYHECLCRLAGELTETGKPLDDPSSRWMTVSEESCSLRVQELMEEVGREYKEGVLLSGAEEAYRLSRMKEVCSRAAWIMVQQVRKGHIAEMHFEERFGRGGVFPPMKVATDQGTLFIEGKIDRVDVLQGDYVKIVDYKSGSEHFDQREARGGWRLQLMLYLEAAINGLSAQGREARPGGVFYFLLQDPCPDAADAGNKELEVYLEKELRKAFKLDGVAADDPAVIDGIAGEFTGYSDVISVQKTAEGFRGNVLTPEEFGDLRKATADNLKKICSALARGTTEARPKKTKNETACRFCAYKNICNFELSFDGCRYDVVQ